VQEPQLGGHGATGRSALDPIRVGVIGVGNMGQHHTRVLGLMKDVELVTNRGSVYLFSTPQIDQWLPALEHLEQRGVGDRTCEGFGQIRVCDEFHTIFREEAK